GPAGIPDRAHTAPSLPVRGIPGPGGWHAHGDLLRRLASGVWDRTPGQDPGSRPDAYGAGLGGRAAARRGVQELDWLVLALVPLGGSGVRAAERVCVARANAATGCR